MAQPCILLSIDLSLIALIHCNCRKSAAFLDIPHHCGISRNAALLRRNDLLCRRAQRLSGVAQFRCRMLSCHNVKRRNLLSCVEYGTIVMKNIRETILRSYQKKFNLVVRPKRLAALWCSILIISLSVSTYAVAAGTKKQRHSPSGIYGYVSGLSNNDERTLYNTPNVQIIITNIRTKRVIKRIYTNANGDFAVSVPPGKYELTAINPPDKAWGGDATATVTVWRGFRTLTYILFTL